MKHPKPLAVLATAVAVTGLFAPTKPYVAHSGRQMARVVYLPNHNPALGVNSFTIQYGTPAWKDSYAAQFDKLASGKRWRFGKDHWTTLDTNVQLAFGRKKLAPGSYYLVLENAGDGRWNLVALDPEKMRKQKLDAFVAHATKGGVVMPLTAAEGPVADKLSIQLTPDPKQQRDVEIKIRFGPHVLTGQLQARI